MKEFLEALRVQRWDDHRYYHHSRINQSLHLVSALSFIVAYGLLFVDPAAAALLAWGVSMTTRQAGHFFFEPKGYDAVNQATHEHKEAIKVGGSHSFKVAGDVIEEFTGNQTTQVTQNVYVKGMQVVIEDYIHGEKTRLACVMANNFFSIAVALASIYAILKLSSGV